MNAALVAEVMHRQDGDRVVLGDLLLGHVEHVVYAWSANRSDNRLFVICILAALQDC